MFKHYLEYLYFVYQTKNLIQRYTEHNTIILKLSQWITVTGRGSVQFLWLLFVFYIFVQSYLTIDMLYCFLSNFFVHFRVFGVMFYISFHLKTGSDSEMSSTSCSLTKEIAKIIFKTQKLVESR